MGTLFLEEMLAMARHHLVGEANDASKKEGF